MLTNGRYDKIKVLHDMSSPLWFLKEHAIKESAKHGHEHCLIYYKELEKDLEKHIKMLEEMVYKQ